MEHYWPIFILFLLFLLLRKKQKRKNAAVINHRLNHKCKEDIEMKELAQKFIGKDCLIYTISSEYESIKGTITEVSDSGLLVENNGNMQAVNLEYITRIQEWPKNSKGKKKTVFN